ncbi:hypothetical protein A2U01_0103982, partial [Trifolium medium]|nr:hypothetical protein [Trifolium medium]
MVQSLYKLQRLWLQWTGGFRGWKASEAGEIQRLESFRSLKNRCYRIWHNIQSLNYKTNTPP